MNKSVAEIDQFPFKRLSRKPLDACPTRFLLLRGRVLLSSASHGSVLCKPPNPDQTSTRAYPGPRSLRPLLRLSRDCPFSEILAGLRSLLPFIRPDCPYHSAGVARWPPRLREAQWWSDNASQHTVDGVFIFL